jgi:hypothetical protein
VRQIVFGGIERQHFKQWLLLSGGIVPANDRQQANKEQAAKQWLYRWHRDGLMDSKDRE